VAEAVGGRMEIVVQEPLADKYPTPAYQAFTRD